jgi:hypothetical protein
MSNKAFVVLFHLHRYFDSVSDLLCSASFRHDSSWSFQFARAGVMPHVLDVDLLISFISDEHPPSFCFA